MLTLEAIFGEFRLVGRLLTISVYLVLVLGIYLLPAERQSSRCWNAVRRVLPRNRDWQDSCMEGDKSTKSHQLSAAKC